MLERRGAGPFIEVALKACESAACGLQALVAQILVADAGGKQPRVVPRQARPTTERREAAPITNRAAPIMIFVRAPLSAEAVPRRRQIGDAVAAGGAVE